MYPIDAVKVCLCLECIWREMLIVQTRMQIVNPSPAAVYTGMLNAVSTISTREGARTLWRGISSVALGAGPAHAVYFASYEVVKEKLGGNGSQQSPFAAAAAGAVATIASDALMNPFDGE